MLEHKYVKNLKILNLHDNRINFKGLKKLIPIYKNLKWLLITSNCINSDDIYNFYDYLKDEEIDITLIYSKIIWLPSTCMFDKLPISKISKEAHLKYYNVPVEKEINENNDENNNKKMEKVDEYLGILNEEIKNNKNNKYFLYEIYDKIIDLKNNIDEEIEKKMKK